MKNKTYILLALILLFSFITKIIRINLPDEYYFDEIYSGYTAEEYAKGNIKAFVWDYPAKKGFAYNWDHPPLGREIMSVAIRFLGVSSFSRRIVPMIAGVLISFMVFKIGFFLFPKKPFIGLTAAFLTSCDGLIFALSRIALVDTILTLFIITSIYFLIRKNYIWSAFFWGAASSCKWTGVFLSLYIAIIIIIQQKWNRNKILTSIIKVFRNGFLYLFIGGFVYISSYTPVIIHYGFEKLTELIQQGYWYHSGLKATHPAQSSALSWIINYKPVWFWVDYQEETIANIYALGNPIIFWSGILAIIFCLIMAIKNKNIKLWYLVLAYPVCWVQWIFSPRIMFLYHYLPAVPILCLTLAYSLDYLKNKFKNGKYFVILYLLITGLTFAYFYPFLSGIPIKNEFVDNFRWLKSWR